MIADGDTFEAMLRRWLAEELDAAIARAGLTGDVRRDVAPAGALRRAAAAAYIGVGLTKLSELTVAGQLVTVAGAGRRVLYRVEDLDAWLRDNRTRPRGRAEQPATASGESIRHLAPRKLRA